MYSNLTYIETGEVTQAIVIVVRYAAFVSIFEDPDRLSVLINTNCHIFLFPVFAAFLVRFPYPSLLVEPDDRLLPTQTQLC